MQSLVSSHPRILLSLCACVHACILHSYIFISSGSCALVCIPAFSCLQVYVCLLVNLYPHILLSLGSCTRVLVGILAFLHPHILRFMYSRCLLVSSHPHILISLGSCVLVCNLVSSHPLILRFTYPVCLLVSSHSYILISLGSCTLGACWYPRILTSSYP